MFVAASPDALLLGRFDQFIAGIGVGDADQKFGAFPRALALEIHSAVFRDHIMGHGTWNRYNAAGRQSRNDAGYLFTFLTFFERRQTDKSLPPLDLKAELMKSSWPPVPVMWRGPEDSEQTCPYRSISMALLTDTSLSCADAMFRSFV